MFYKILGSGTEPEQKLLFSWGCKTPNHTACWKSRQKEERERGRHKAQRERKKAIFYVSQDERWLAGGRPGRGRCGGGDRAKCRKSWAACLTTLTNNVLGRQAFLFLPPHFLRSTYSEKCSMQDNWAEVTAAGSVSHTSRDKLYLFIYFNYMERVYWTMLSYILISALFHHMLVLLLEILLKSLGISVPTDYNPVEFQTVGGWGGVLRLPPNLKSL